MTALVGLALLVTAYVTTRRALRRERAQVASLRTVIALTPYSRRSG